MRIRHIKGVEELITAEPLVIQEPQEYKGRWRSAVFGNDAPLYLEIGMGMGTFIRTHSFNHPDINYIGLELNTTVLYKAVTRYKAELEARCAHFGPVADKDSGAEYADTKATNPEEDREAVSSLNDSDACVHAGIVSDVEILRDRNEDAMRGNLRFIRSNARFLEEYFEQGEIDKIYLNFSDPWPKEHSAGRRLTSPQFLKLYEQMLKSSGNIEFKTDNRGLFDYSVETIPACGWNIDAITYDLHNDLSMNEGNIMTEYEAKFSAKGNPIYKLIASRGETCL